MSAGWENPYDTATRQKQGAPGNKLPGLGSDWQPRRRDGCREHQCKQRGSDTEEHRGGIEQAECRHSRTRNGHRSSTYGFCKIDDSVKFASGKILIFFSSVFGGQSTVLESFGMTERDATSSVRDAKRLSPTKGPPLL